jgi:hypothetical protein
VNPVFVPIEKKLDRQLDVCRKGAQTNRCTVYLVSKPRNAAPHSDPSTWDKVFEITPAGDVRELPAKGLTVTLRDRMLAAGLGTLVDATDLLVKEQAAADAARIAKREEKRAYFRKLAADKRKAVQAAQATKAVA